MVELPDSWETKRILLRPAVIADAPAAFEAYTSIPEVSRYMTWKPHRSVAETEVFFRRCEDVRQKRVDPARAAMLVGSAALHPGGRLVASDVHQVRFRG